MSLEQKVREFALKYGHLVSPQAAVTIPNSVKQLRMDLIREEYEETMTAIQNNDLVEIADGLADLTYVVIGTAIAYGIPFDRVFEEVHRSNMTKTAVKAEEGQKYGTKTPKGPNFIPPHLWRILFEPEFLTELEKNGRA